MLSQSSRINLYVTVSRQSVRYYDYCIANYLATASLPERIEIIAICIEDVSVFLSKFNRKFVIPQLNSSVTHAEAINNALRDIDQYPDAIGVFADSDTVMLQCGWDTVVDDLLRKHDIIGCVYEDINGFSSGSGKLQTYKRLPTATWFAVRKSDKARWSDLDMSLSATRATAITTDEQSRIYNLPIGYSLCSGEVGWKIPRFIYDNNLLCYAFIHTKPTKTAIVVKTGNDYHEEFQLTDGTPFIAHQRGSRKHAFKSEPVSAPFYAACEAHLKRITHAK